MRRLLLTICTLALGALGVAAPAGAIAGTTPGTVESYPPSAVAVEFAISCGLPPTISGAITSVRPGSTVTIVVTPAPGAGWRMATPIATLTSVAGSDGRALFSFPRPAEGVYQVHATGIRPDGSAFSVTQRLDLEPCPTLPATGTSSTGPTLTLAAMALMVGLVLVVSARRARRAVA